MTVERPSTNVDDLVARLRRSPDVYPQKIDLNSLMVLLVQLDADAYRQSSFLDDRIITPATVGAWASFARVTEESRGVADSRPLHFIFHTGHVGSTLVSRLLDETRLVLSLREPLPLRTLAEAHDALGRSDALLSAGQLDSALTAMLRLWSRGYPATRSVVVKATSSVGRIAHPLLERNPSSRAIYLNLRAEPYLATLLAGQNSAADLRGHGPERIRRLQARIAAALAPLHALSTGELAAMGWLAESWSQRDAVARHRAGVMAVDFDQFLGQVAPGMERILRHFGLPAEPAQIDALGRSPVLSRYSKAPEFAYTPETRAELLRDSRRRNAGEIRRGLAWLEELARSDDGAAQVLQAAA